MNISKEVSDPEIIRDYSNLLDTGDEDNENLIGPKLGHWTIKEVCTFDDLIDEQKLKIQNRLHV